MPLSVRTLLQTAGADIEVQKAMTAVVRESNEASEASLVEWLRWREGAAAPNTNRTLALSHREWLEFRSSYGPSAVLNADAVTLVRN